MFFSRLPVAVRSAGSLFCVLGRTKEWILTSAPEVVEAAESPACACHDVFWVEAVSSSCGDDLLRAVGEAV